MGGFIPGISIQFHQSIILLLCQDYAVLMTVTLQHSLESERWIPSVAFCFLETVLVIQSLHPHTNCGYISPSSVKNTFGNLIKVALTLQIALGNILLFTILVFLIQEHGIFIQLFMSSLISFIMFMFFFYSFFVSSSKFIPTYFIFFHCNND